MEIWALIPVKSLLQSKRRLAHVLDAEQRADLIAGLLRRELDILTQMPALSEVLVISSDPGVWTIARDKGVLVEEEMVSTGLNAAAARGMVRAAAQGAGAVLILPVDLPYLSTADVYMMLESGQNSAMLEERLPELSRNSGGEPPPSGAYACQMTICADEIGEGTNALLLNPARDFRFHYGPGSFQKHLLEARQRGRQVRVVSAPGLKFDIDNERDWFAYQASTIGC